METDQIIYETSENRIDKYDWKQLVTFKPQIEKKEDNIKKCLLYYPQKYRF